MNCARLRYLCPGLLLITIIVGSETQLIENKDSVLSQDIAQKLQSRRVSASSAEVSIQEDHQPDETSGGGRRSSSGKSQRRCLNQTVVVDADVEEDDSSDGDDHASSSAKIVLITSIYKDLSNRQKFDETLFVLWRNLQLDEIETAVVFLEKMSAEELKTRVMAVAPTFKTGMAASNDKTKIRKGKEEKKKKRKTATKMKNNKKSGNRSALEDDKGVDHHTAVGEKMSELERNQDEEEERRKERAQALVRDKLIAVEVKGQPTYKTFIKYSFANLQGRLVLISNSDIYFDDSLSCIANRHSLQQMRTNRLFFAITKAAAPECPNKVFSSAFRAHAFQRLQKCVPGFRSAPPFSCGWNNMTADSFIFVPYISPSSLSPDESSEENACIIGPADLEDALSLLDYPQNRMGAENFLSHVMESRLGYQAINPCRKIVGKHLHCTGSRSAVTKKSVKDMYQEAATIRIRMPGSFVYPSWLSACPERGFSVWTPRGHPPPQQWFHDIAKNAKAKNCGFGNFSSTW